MKSVISSNRFISLIASVLFVLSSQMILATSYVTLNDGRLLVFPDSCVKSSTVADGYLSITALDGTVYSYNMEGIKSIDKILLKQLPFITSYKFDNKKNYQVFTDASGVITGNRITADVTGIGKWLTASFSLSDGSACATVDGILQINGQSRLRFDPSRIYTVGYPGDLILARLPSGTYDFMPFGRKYTVTVHYLTDNNTAVPRIDINTVGGVNITSKKEYVDAEIIIDGAGIFPSMTDSVQIKGRGNTSWSSNPDSKNPYRLKFSEKVKPFGLTKGKNWVLLANKLKGSMLTNAIGMKAASLMGTEAANHIIPVDLYINGKYKGSYNFTEKVGLANNSVELDDETTAALLELDKYYDESTGQKFRSDPYRMPVNIKEPDFSEGTTLITLNDIRQRFNAFSSAVQNSEGISEHADIEVLARYYLLNKYICNLELFHPKSIFCYYENVLDDNSKLKFGPVWDLDWAFGYDGSNYTSYFNNNIEYDYLNNGLAVMSMYEFMCNIDSDPEISKSMYLIMKDFMENGLDELCDYCLEFYEFAKPSFLNNKAASLDNTDYATQAEQAVNWVRNRAEFLYEGMREKYETTGDINLDGEVGIGDISALMDIILGTDADEETKTRADINNDGEITVSDINALIIIIMKH